MPELKVPPGTPMRVHLDGPFRPDELNLEGRIERMHAEERAIVLTMPPLAKPGERVTLRVRFADGVQPERITLALVAQKEGTDTEVWVERDGNSPAVLRKELTRCETEEAVRPPLEFTRPPQNWGQFNLMNLLEQRDTRSLKETPEAFHIKQYPREALFPDKCMLLLLQKRGVVFFLFRPTNSPMWIPGSATLTLLTDPPRSEEVPIKVFLANNPHGPEGLIAMEVGRVHLQTKIRLEIRDNTGGRPVMLETKGSL